MSQHWEEVELEYLLYRFFLMFVQLCV